MFLKLTKMCGTVALFNMSPVTQVCQEDGNDFTTLYYETVYLPDGDHVDTDIEVLETLDEILAMIAVKP